MVSPKPRSLAPTMAERLTAAGAVPQICSHRGWIAATNWSLDNGPVSVLPEPTPTVARRPRAEKVVAPPADARKARLLYPSGKSSPATAALGHHTLEDAVKLAEKERTKFVWYAKDGRLLTRMLDNKESLASVCDVGTDSLVSLLNSQAPRGKSKHIELPPWATKARSGWVIGGPLGSNCRTCERPLDWADWWHPDATRIENSCFVYCPDHGVPIVEKGELSLQYLIDSRRQLDSTLWAQPTQGDNWEVYVLGIVGRKPSEVYVGESWHAPKVRRLQHINGIRKGRVFGRPGVKVGRLRQRLLPQLPTLHSRECSQAAEQWVAFVLRHQGMKVHGGH